MKYMIHSYRLASAAPKAKLAFGWQLFHASKPSDTQFTVAGHRFPPPPYRCRRRERLGFLPALGGDFLGRAGAGCAGGCDAACSGPCSEPRSAEKSLRPA